MTLAWNLQAWGFRREQGVQGQRRLTIHPKSHSKLEPGLEWLSWILAQVSQATAPSLQQDLCVHGWELGSRTQWQAAWTCEESGPGISQIWWSQPYLLTSPCNFDLLLNLWGLGFPQL